MSVIGNYAAVVFVRASLIKRVLHTTHAAFGDRLRRSFSVVISTPAGTATITGSIFLEEPKVTLARNPANAIEVSMVACSRISLTLGGQSVAGAALRLAGTVQLMPMFSDPKRLLGDTVLSLSNLSVEALSIELLEWPGSPYLQGVILGKEVRQALVDQLKKLDPKLLRLTIPISNLDNINQLAPKFRPSSIVVLDECMGVCFDILYPKYPVGNASAVKEPWQEYDQSIAPVVNNGEVNNNHRPFASGLELLVVMRASMVKEVLELQALLISATIMSKFGIDRMDKPKVQLGIDRVNVKVSGKRDDGRATVSMDLLLLRVPVGGWRPVPRNIVTQVDPEFDIFGTLASIAEHELDQQIADAVPSSIPIVDLSYAGPIPGMPAVDKGAGEKQLSVYVSLASVAWGPGDVFVGGHVNFSKHDSEFFFVRRPPPPPTYVRTGHKLTRIFGTTIEDQWICAGTDYPTARRDPSLRLTLRARDFSGTDHWEKYGWADDMALNPVQIDLWREIELYTLHGFRLSAALSRGGTQVGNSELMVQIFDPLNRSKPFVRRNRTVSWTIVDENGQEVSKYKVRRGAIHKTAYPGRCQFSDAFKSSAHQLEDLDELPSGASAELKADEDIGNSSRRLCAYCFYGGPDKVND